LTSAAAAGGVVGCSSPDILQNSALFEILAKALQTMTNEQLFKDNACQLDLFRDHEMKQILAT
jgi:hypothetical protein